MGLCVVVGRVGPGVVGLPLLVGLTVPEGMVVRGGPLVTIGSSCGPLVGLVEPGRCVEGAPVLETMGLVELGLPV